MPRGEAWCRWSLQVGATLTLAVAGCNVPAGRTGPAEDADVVVSRGVDEDERIIRGLPDEHHVTFVTIDPELGVISRLTIIRAFPPVMQKGAHGHRLPGPRSRSTASLDRQGRLVSFEYWEADEVHYRLEFDERGRISAIGVWEGATVVGTSVRWDDGVAEVTVDDGDGSLARTTEPLDARTKSLFEQEARRIADLVVRVHGILEAELPVGGA
jgi:hypothetical protein